MEEKTGLHLYQRQRQHLTQQQVRLARMLEMTAPEIEEAVAAEVEANPALETAESEPEEGFNETSEDLQRADYSSADELPPYLARNRWEDPSWRDNIQQRDDSESLYDNLILQIGERRLEPLVELAARDIIGNLDSNGYLRRTPQGVADDLAFNFGVEVELDVVERALEVVKGLDPAGIGASDLREALLLQLRRLPRSQERDDSLLIVERAFEAFSMKHSHKLVSELGLTQQRVSRATDFILTLNPKPGSALGSGPGETAKPIIPDYMVDDSEGELVVTLNSHIPELQISETFERAHAELEAKVENGAEPRGRQGRAFVNGRYNEARDFIQTLRMRQQTLFDVMTAIVGRQRRFFETHDVHDLVPLGLKDVAADSGHDMSVVSRATSNKYVATTRGIYPLRYFFSDNLGTGGKETVTVRAIEDVMKTLIEGEDPRRPLSDEQLRELLAERGYEVKRRTVAKYRDRMKIPVARLRRK